MDGLYAEANIHPVRYFKDSSKIENSVKLSNGVNLLADGKTKNLRENNLQPLNSCIYWHVWSRVILPEAIRLPDRRGFDMAKYLSLAYNHLTLGCPVFSPYSGSGIHTANIHRVLVGVAFIVLCLMIAPTILAEELYVAPTGNNANPGTLRAPLASLTEAKKRVRRIRSEAKEPVTVYLRGGIYYLPETIRFEPDDSGTAEAPITYAAYSNEKVVISGGVELYPKWKTNRNGILKAKVDMLFGEFDQLFVDGKRQIMARWPNYQSDQRGVDVGYTTGIEEPVKPIRKFVYDPSKFSPRRWARPHEAIIHIFQAHYWGNLQWRIGDIDFDTRTIILGEGGWQIGSLWYAERAVYINPRCRFYIENVLEELDAPGEWYYDRKARELYYKPAKGVDVAKARFVAAGHLKELFVFKGKSRAGVPTDSVKHLNLLDMTFMHTARIFLEPYEARLRGDWAIARLGAVRFDGAEDCTVNDCFFDAVGGNGVFISNYARRVNVIECHFGQIGESAVCLVGNDDAVRNLGMHKVRYASHDGIDTTPGPRSLNYPANCRIYNNLIHEIGLFGKQTAGVYISAAEKITISHNTIYHAPRAGICINDGCWGGHVIEFNDVFQTVRETGDHGPFNSWGRDRYWQSYHREGLPCDMSRSRQLSKLDSRTPTVIQNNRFVHEARGHSWGIDLDDGSSNYVVRNNLCLGCAVKLREGFFRTVENNVFVTPFPPAKQCCFRGSSDIIRHNILVDISGNRGWIDICDPPVEMDHNLYYNFRGEMPVFSCHPNSMGEGFKSRMTMSEWQAQGLDKYSVYADPQFVAPEEGDFSVKAASPALDLGFKNFPMDQFGTQKVDYKEIVAKVHRKYRLVNNQLQ